MNTPHIHEGTLFLDHNNRYAICEPEQPVFQTVTLTPGCALEILLGGQWVTGHVEGDGADYWLFVQAGGKLKLAEGMTVRYTEPCWYTPCMDDKQVAILGRYK